jgi:putative restriction endonuclease
VLDEFEVRLAAMAYVASCTDAGAGVITREQLEDFHFQGEQIKLIDQSRGIRNPSQLQATISILTKVDGPYDDSDFDDGRLHYSYRSGSTTSGDNRKLRMAGELGLPVILLRGIAPRVFVPIFPVYVTRSDPDESYVEVALDESLRFLPIRDDPDQRSYVERLMRQRIHQPMFRAQVIRAYGTQCAMCRLRHGDLLDAAHILPDTHANGLPVVPNGLSLCKIHHAAYDRNIIGIRPDLIVEIQPAVLAEVDGPMLKHGLQEMGGVRIEVPAAQRSRPDPDRLAERYEEFKAVG